MTKCTIKRCEEDATALVIIDRPAPPPGSSRMFWHGHMEHPYCGEHAIQRPHADGFAEYGDTWIMRPLDTA